MAAGKNSEAWDGGVEVGWGPITLVAITLVTFPGTGGRVGERFVPQIVFLLVGDVAKTVPGRGVGGVVVGNQPAGLKGVIFSM